MFVLSDVCPDSPHMPSTFFKCIFKPLMEKKLLSFDKMDWCEPDPEEIFAVDGHLKFFLHLLEYQSEKLGGDPKAIDWFKNQGTLIAALDRLKKSIEVNG